MTGPFLTTWLAFAALRAQLDVLTVSLVASIGVGMTAGLLAWRERTEPGGLALVLMLAGQCFWSVTLFFELNIPDVATKLLVANVRWLGIVVIPVGWLLFALDYTGRSQYIRPRIIAALFVVPAITVVLALTSQQNDLLYVASEPVQSGSVTLLSRTPGPWFWVITAYTYTLGLLGSIPLLELVRNKELPFRGQSSAVLLGTLMPWASNALFLADVIPVEGLDPTPFAFGIAGVAYLGALTRFQLLGDSPSPSRRGREIAFSEMEQGTLVVDRNDFVVDINPKAAEMLDVSREDALGEQADVIFPGYEKLPEQTDSREPVILEVRGRSYEVMVSQITDPYGRTTSRILALNDISEYLRQQERLEVLNRAFRHNIRTQTQVIMGNANYLADNNDPARADLIREKAIDIEDIGNKCREVLKLFEQKRTAPEPISLAGIVEGTAESLRAEFPDVAIDCSEVPDDLYVDKAVDLVFKNVLENAAMHNTNDEPAVSVDVRVDENTVELTVADNGPGIGEYERKVIEERRETKLEHTDGFGLWLVVWGTDIAGGQVSFEENDPTGSVIRVTVPIRGRGQPSVEEAADPDEPTPEEADPPTAD